MAFFWVICYNSDGNGKECFVLDINNSLSKDIDKSEFDKDIAHWIINNKGLFYFWSKRYSFRLTDDYWSDFLLQVCTNLYKLCLKKNEYPILVLIFNLFVYFIKESKKKYCTTKQDICIDHIYGLEMKVSLPSSKKRKKLYVNVIDREHVKAVIGKRCVLTEELYESLVPELVILNKCTCRSVEFQNCTNLKKIFKSYGSYSMSLSRSFSPIGVGKRIKQL